MPSLPNLMICPECRRNAGAEPHEEGCPLGPIAKDECAWCGDGPAAAGDRLCLVCRHAYEAATAAAAAIPTGAREPCRPCLGLGLVSSPEARVTVPCPACGGTGRRGRS